MDDCGGYNGKGSAPANARPMRDGSATLVPAPLAVGHAGRFDQGRKRPLKRPLNKPTGTQQKDEDPPLLLFVGTVQSDEQRECHRAIDVKYKVPDDA